MYKLVAALQNVPLGLIMYKLVAALQNVPLGFIMYKLVAALQNVSVGTGNCKTVVTEFESAVVALQY